MYNYTDGSLFDNPINYSFSSYKGDRFIDEWLFHRKSYLKELVKNNKLKVNVLSHPDLPTILDSNQVIANEEESSKLILQKYESTKKIYSKYIDYKTIKASGFSNLDHYVSSACLIERVYYKTKDIRYLNCLLKLCDLFQSDRRFFSYSYYLSELINKEINHISVLVSQSSDLQIKVSEPSGMPLNIYENPNKIKGLILLCCKSSRSSIYLQSLLSSNIFPEYIIYMNSDIATYEYERYPYIKSNPTSDWIFLPKEYINPIELAKENNIKLINIKTNSVNSKLIFDQLTSVNPKLIIYCGYSGEIVSPELIEKFKFLHCHAGSLPKFRGSTTFYYEILSKNLPTVSCILLNKRIDTGPILALKSFPIPFKTDDVDNLYEPSIRANLLCDVLLNSDINLNLNSKPQLVKERALNYYIIHPVLKHVSFSMFKDPS